MRICIEYEFDSFILGNGKLQGTSSVLMLVRTRAGRPIILSYQALWSFLGIKSYLFCAIITSINSKYQSTDKANLHLTFD